MTLLPMSARRQRICSRPCSAAEPCCRAAYPVPSDLLECEGGTAVDVDIIVDARADAAIVVPAAETETILMVMETCHTKATSLGGQP